MGGSSFVASFIKSTIPLRPKNVTTCRNKVYTAWVFPTIQIRMLFVKLVSYAFEVSYTFRDHQFF